MSGRVLGWRLDRDDRAALLARFPPVYAEAVVDHVTLRSGVGEDEPLPHPVSAEIVGRVDDGAGVEAMAVRIDGSVDRPDGSTYHITWSLDEGRRAKESNDVLAALGWQDFGEAIPVRVSPARW